MSLSGIFRAVTVLFLVTSYTEVCVLSLHHFLPEHEFTLTNPLSFSFSLLAGRGIGIDVLPPQLFLGPPWSSYSL